ncbi:MAG: DNA translocase FtsK, partial [Clostridiales bacterium]|nr:DNA translocase FtsK [Clostridiales bacterium]
MANTKKTSSSKSGAGRNASARKKDPAPKSAGRTTAKQRAEEEAALEKRIRERNRIVSVVVFACALFVFFVALIEGDGPWRALHNFYLGLFGFGAYLLPILSIAVAVIASLEEREYSIGAKSIQTGVMILLLCALIHVIQYDGSSGYFETVLAAYQDAAVTINGGFFGALIGGVFLTFGKAGAIITNVLLLFVNFMILSGFTLIQFFRSLWKPVQKTGEQILPAIENQWEARRTRARQPEIDVPLGPPQMDDTQKLDLDPQRIRMRQIVPDLGDETPVQPDGPKGFADPPADPDGPKGFDGPPAAAAESAGHSKPARKEPPLEEIVKKAAGTNTKKKKDEEPVDRLFVPKEAMESRVDDYQLPPLGLLKPARQTASRDVSGELKLNAEKLVDTLRSFGVETKITDISRGPSVTRYELKPSAGVKISRITGLADDIALNLAASGVRIEAPIPNKAAVGIEVPNKVSSTVSMRELLETPEFCNAKSKLTAGLGKDITGNCVYCDVAKMPHLLIAGATGAGKSVCMNSIIVSILYKAKPEEVKFLMIDPKKVEFAMYSGIPHLLVPVVTDPRKASGALGWAVTEMLQRYKMFADNSVKDIAGYNRLADMRDDMQRMPQIVIFIDELADLMMAAPNEVEDSICRLAQMARAAGMHLVIA